MKFYYKNIVFVFTTLAIVVLFNNFIAQSASTLSSLTVGAVQALESIPLTNQNQKPNAEIELQAARGETESFQIMIQAPNNKYLSNLNVSVSDLRSNDQKTIPQNNITLYREHYVYVDQPSPANWVGNPTRGKGWYADGLIPFVDESTGKDIVGASLDAVPFDLAINRTQPIWVDIFVPRDTPPGEYEGTYTVVSDQGEGEGKINFTVWDFELPIQPTMNSYFNPWKDRGESMVEELLKHKVMPGKRIKPEREKELTTQWGLNSILLPFWSGANYQTCKLSPAPSVKEIKQTIEPYDSSLLKLVYSVDEVDKCPNIVKPIQEWGKNVHQAGAKHLVVMKPRPELYDSVDIWVVQPQMYVDSKQQIAEVMNQGDQVWFYAGHQTGYSPQWMIDTPPINFRIPQGFIAQSLDLTGVLYPQVDGWADNTDNLPLWSNDPWHIPSVYQQGKKNFPGEGMLLYPGAEVGIEGVVPSIRLKRIRDGIEDYEYIEILKKLGYEDWAMKTVRQVGKDWYTWTKDNEILYSARNQLGKKIHQLASND